jgi:protein Mpv17
MVAAGARILFLYAGVSLISAFTPRGTPVLHSNHVFSYQDAFETQPVTRTRRRGGSPRPANMVVSRPITRTYGSSQLFQSSIGIDTGSTTEAEATAQQINIFVGGSSSAISEKPPLSEFGTSNVSFLELLGRTVQSAEFQRKVLNCLILLSSFGFAAYTILSIDNGMTRGWSSSEIAMRIPLDNWLNYENSLADRPIVTKTMINVIIYLLGDWLSQTVFCGKNLLDFDASRTLRNGFIGLCFGPLVHEYYQFSDHILPVEGGMLNRFEKILMDQTVYLTVKCSIYISAVGLMNGDDVPTVKQNVQDKLPKIVLTAWKFWPLVHLVTYGLIPARHRILWVNCVDLVWNAILAGMSQRSQEGGDDAVVAVAHQEGLPATLQAAELSVVEVADNHVLTGSSIQDHLVVLSNDAAPISSHSEELSLQEKK